MRSSLLDHFWSLKSYFRSCGLLLLLLLLFVVMWSLYLKTKMVFFLWGLLYVNLLLHSIFLFHLGIFLYLDFLFRGFMVFACWISLWSSFYKLWFIHFYHLKKKVFDLLRIEFHFLFSVILWNSRLRYSVYAANYQFLMAPVWTFHLLSSWRWVSMLTFLVSICLRCFLVLFFSILLDCVQVVALLIL